MDTNEGRRFDEKEFALILRRAAELQARSAESPVPAALTLRDIESIAAEAGIEPRYVREAIATADVRSSGPLRSIVGPPTTITAQASVPGEPDADTLAAVLEVLQAELGRPGTTRDVLGGIEWRGRDSFGNVQVTVRPQAGESRVQIAADRQETALVLAILMPIGGLIAGGILASATGAPPAPTVAALAVGGLAGARLIWARVSAKWERRVARLMERIVHAVGGSKGASRDEG